MTISFFTNYINHHQLPLSDELFRLLGLDYHYIEVCNTENLINSMSGYSLIGRPYIIRPYLTDSEKNKALKLAVESDVVIWGGFESIQYIKLRYKLRRDALTYEYGEHWLKKGWVNILSPRLWLNKLLYYTLAQKKYTFRLCASAYAAQEEKMFFSYKKKCLKWAYFTEVPDFDVESSIAEREKSEVVRILWIGRFLHWKHPEKMIALAKELNRLKLKCNIIMIGKGPVLDSIVKEVHDSHLEHIVTMKGTYPNSEILQLMRSCHIICTTSDRNEGWGAVLNEGMSAACCPVASINAGSTPYLIQNGQNGFSFKNDDEFIDIVKTLILSPEKRSYLMLQAYKTMRENWNAAVAAKRLIDFSNSIISGCLFQYDDGPMSKA